MSAGELGNFVWGGGLAKYFFRGRNVHQVSVFQDFGRVLGPLLKNAVAVSFTKWNVGNA